MIRAVGSSSKNVKRPPKHLARSSPVKVLLKLFLIHGTRKAANTETGQAIGSGFLSFLPDLIFLAVVAAIVFGICHWTESEAVKKLKSSGSKKLKETMDRLNLWVWFYLAAFAVLALIVPLFGVIGAEADEEGGGIGVSGFLFIIFMIVMGGVGFWNVTVSFWKEIPEDIARTTPQKAAGYSFIPFFAWYWWFIAFRGLVEDLNKTASRYGHADLVDLNFATVICAFWVLCGMSMFIPYGPILLVLLVLTNIVLTFTFFLTLRNNTARLMLHMATAES